MDKPNKNQFGIVQFQIFYHWRDIKLNGRTDFLFTGTKEVSEYYRVGISWKCKIFTQTQWYILETSCLNSQSKPDLFFHQIFLSYYSIFVSIISPLVSQKTWKNIFKKVLEYIKDYFEHFCLFY